MIAYPLTEQYYSVMTAAPYYRTRRIIITAFTEEKASLQLPRCEV